MIFVFEKNGALYAENDHLFNFGWGFVMNSPNFETDDVDFRILKLLVSDGRSTDVALGEQLGLSSTAVARRRRIMEEAGVITGYRAQLSMEALGFSGVVLVMIELRSQAEQHLNEFEREVIKCPSMSYCGFISGDTDFMLIVHVSSLDEYDNIYRKELSNLPHVAKIRSSFVLREVAQRSSIPAIFERSRAGKSRRTR
ncbi:MULTISPECIES: Lrp/AsnC family transcriptional regulator [unclassified Novosphingobium]|uniref:Lrp/AsnC family transcriptional regulator n=1 Tax=unclassified Novosphingobium TaxID=2644732 RepID=UPI0025FC92B4|nr:MULTISPECIES: Lrp/AsnC family transcriptional regulator [unclassified Novosphingobium]